MTAVKGSEQYRLIVAPYRPWRKITFVTVVLLLMAALVVGSFWLGKQEGASSQANAVAERDQLRIDVQDKSLELNNLRQEVANLKLGSQVDRKASEGVKTEVVELKGQIAALQEDIGFYRGLMSPTSNDRGLTIGSLNVISRGVPRQYNYKLVVQQLATRHDTLNGNLTFTVVGQQDDKLMTLHLKDISDNVSYKNIKLRFKYFQTIEGVLTLPENFEPIRIELVAQTSGTDKVVVEKKFGWLVQEN